MESIKKEPEETCIYKRLYLDYHYGLNGISSTEEIEKAKKSPSFEREYCLKFSGRIGNLLSQRIVDHSITLGEQLKHIPMNPYAIHSLGIDPGFGSSATAFSTNRTFARASHYQSIVRRTIWRRRYSPRASTDYR